MKAVIKEDRNTPKVADEGGDGGQGNRRGHRRGAHRFNHVAGGGSGLLYEQRIERRCASR